MPLHPWCVYYQGREFKKAIATTVEFSRHSPHHLFLFLAIIGRKWYPRCKEWRRVVQNSAVYLYFARSSRSEQPLLDVSFTPFFSLVFLQSFQDRGGFVLLRFLLFFFFQFSAITEPRCYDDDNSSSHDPQDDDSPNMKKKSRCATAMDKLDGRFCLAAGFSSYFLSVQETVASLLTSDRTLASLTNGNPATSLLRLFLLFSGCRIHCCMNRSGGFVVLFFFFLPHSPFPISMRFLADGGTNMPFGLANWLLVWRDGRAPFQMGTVFPGSCSGIGGCWWILGLGRPIFACI
jgi:hypothetical protein